MWKKERREDISIKDIDFAIRVIKTVLPGTLGDRGIDEVAPIIARLEESKGSLLNTRLKEYDGKYFELGLEPSIASVTNWRISHALPGDYLMCKNKTDTKMGDFYKLIQKKHNIRFCGHAYGDESYTFIDFYVSKVSKNDKRIKFDIYDGRIIKNSSWSNDKYDITKVQTCITARPTRKDINPEVVVFKNVKGIKHFYQCKIIGNTKLIEVIEVEPVNSGELKVAEKK